MSVKYMANDEPYKQNTSIECVCCKNITNYWTWRYIDEINLSTLKFDHPLKNPGTLYGKHLCIACAENVPVFCFICNRSFNIRRTVLVHYRLILKPKGHEFCSRTGERPCGYDEMCYVCIDCCNKNDINYKNFL